MIYYSNWSLQFKMPHFYSMISLLQDDGFGNHLASPIDFDLWDSFLYEDLH